MAVMSGTLNLPGFEMQRDRYESVRWIPRGWQWVDPAREIAAYKTAVRSGFMTLTDVIAQNGGDFEELAQTRSRELELCDELELVLDTDPEMTTEQGQAQPEPVDTEDDTTSSDAPSGQPQDLVD